MLLINLHYLLILSFALFTIGFIGLALNRKNFLIVIISIELLLLSINFNFILFSLYLDDLIGQIFVLFILTIAATESAIGLAILIIYYKLHNQILLDLIKTIKN